MSLFIMLEMATFTQQKPPMAIQYQVHPFAVDRKRVLRGSLSPSDTVSMSGIRYVLLLNPANTRRRGDGRVGKYLG